MGHINHNAIIATTWNEKVAVQFQSWIEAYSLNKGSVAQVVSRSNGYTTFFVGPDGSKEGWPVSDYGDKVREQIKKRFALDNYEDGSSPWNWIEVGYGEYGQKVLDGNCKNCFNDMEYAMHNEAHEEGERLVRAAPEHLCPRCARPLGSPAELLQQQHPTPVPVSERCLGRCLGLGLG